MQNKRFISIMMVAGILLMLPFIAMQFTSEVNWSTADFVLAGVLLFGTGLVCELVLRNIRKIQIRIALCAAVLLTLLLVWIELAVGLFGTAFAGS